jgi:hypothetical protein
MSKPWMWFKPLNSGYFCQNTHLKKYVGLNQSFIRTKMCGAAFVYASTSVIPYISEKTWVNCFS